MKVKQYRMIAADGPEAFALQVDDLLRQGWDLVGQVMQRPDGRLCREMVLPEHVGEVWREGRWEKIT
jgi:hypothetical protein